MAEQKSAQERAAAAASKDNPDAGKQQVDTKPLDGVEPAGVRQAGGEASHKEFVASDPHAFEAQPQGGFPVPVELATAAKDRREAGIPEPPKVNPNGTTDLYDTPGGYQAVPAGFDPYGLEQANSKVREAIATPADPSKVGAEIRKVAGGQKPKDA